MNRRATRISVAMAAYNGERFIAEQLASIAAQTLTPYEIVIVDDHSNDQTALIIAGFAQSVAIPVRVLHAERNFGTTVSFERAIAACTGDWIALADQDDIWLPHKLSCLLAAGESRRWDAVFSDARIVDEVLGSGGGSLLRNMQLSQAMRAKFLVGVGLAPLLRYSMVAGTTLMFRASSRDAILPIPPPWLHDHWIAMLLASVGRIGLCDEELVLYRQHGRNQIGIKENWSREWVKAQRKDPQQYRFEAMMLRQLRARLESLRFAKCAVTDILQRKEVFLERRYRTHCGKPGRFWAFGQNLLRGDHFRFGRGWKGVLKDVLL